MTGVTSTSRIATFQTSRSLSRRGAFAQAVLVAVLAGSASHVSLAPVMRTAPEAFAGNNLSAAGYTAEVRVAIRPLDLTHLDMTDFGDVETLN